MAVKDTRSERKYVLVFVVVLWMILSLVQCEEHLLLDEARGELGRLPIPAFFFVGGLVLLTNLDELHALLV